MDVPGDTIDAQLEHILNAHGIDYTQQDSQLDLISFDPRQNSIDTQELGQKGWEDSVFSASLVHAIQCTCSLSFSLVVLSHSWLGMHRDGQENIQADQRLEEWIDRHDDVLSKQCT